MFLMRLAGLHLNVALRRFLRRQEGAQLIEYVLVIGLAGMLVFAVLGYINGKDQKLGEAVWNVINSWLKKAQDTTGTGSTGG